MNELYIWAQMFFDDGSVTEGKRVLDTAFQDKDYMRDIAETLLKSVNRTEGFLLVWGAGDIRGSYCDFTSSSEESGFLEPSQEIALPPQSKIEEFPGL